MATEAVVVVQAADSEAVTTCSPPSIDKVFEFSEAVTKAVTAIISTEVGPLTTGSMVKTEDAGG